MPEVIFDSTAPLHSEFVDDILKLIDNPRLTPAQAQRVAKIGDEVVADQMSEAEGYLKISKIGEEILG